MITNSQDLDVVEICDKRLVWRPDLMSVTMILWPGVK